MRSSLVGLQLLLACVLVWGTSVVEEKKKQTSEEMEERIMEYREMMGPRGPHEAMFLKQMALDYFNKRKTDAFYRPIEDTDVNVKNAIGTIVAFTQFLAKTNCTKEEGRKYSVSWDDSIESFPCAALPKHEQKRLKCRVSMFVDAVSGHSAILQQKCEPVVFLDDSKAELDRDHLMDFSAGQFEPFF